MLFKQLENTNDANQNINTVNENTNNTVDTNTSSQTNTNATPTTGEIDTSNWLTYSNVEYGFSFRYPSDWKIQQKGSYINVYSPEKAKELAVDPVTSPDLYIKIEEDKNTDSVEEFYRDKTNFHIVKKSEKETIIAFDEYNEFAQSDSQYYYFQRFSQSTIYANFFKDNRELSTILAIIDTVKFTS